jgi:YidC/Oxa1 family membrane protein insertase
MDRQLLLVFALTFLVIVLFQPLLKKYLPQPAAPSQPQAQTQNAPASSSGTPNQIIQSNQPKVPPAAGSKVASTETETVIEDDLYRIVFTNRGAQVKSWVLKKFDDDKGRPLDLVNTAASEKYGYPLSLWTYDEAERDRLNSALYVASASGTVRAPADITFEYSEQGVAVRKAFHFDHSYLVRLESSVVANGSTVTAYPAWPSGFGDQVSSPSFAAGRVEHQYNNHIERITFKKVSGGATLRGPFNWVDTADQYFAAVFILDDPDHAAAVTLRNALEIPKDPQKPNPNETVKVDVLGAAVGNPSGATSERVYVGPKQLRTLEETSIPTIIGAEPDLRGLVDFGRLQPIARPLFLWLKWTYEHIVPNWGWAIVIQTFIISLALLPLRISSIRSALKMQKIQPQMNAIKEKYKKYSMRDPRRQEMNTEIGELMKREGVNPVGGCLPLIIQMPFIFAYYSMLNSALDLRHAHWLWIHDLSSRDPWFLLPLLLVVSMIVTQRMTPQTGMDPTQQRMMNLMMPLMMGFIFFNLAAGLNLYYSESNLIMIVQQALMNRTSLGREMRELAEKRARKKEKKEK